MTSKKKKKKKKKGHHVKVYFKFVYALLFTTFALLFEEFYCPPKGFQKFGSYVLGAIYPYNILKISNLFLKINLNVWNFQNVILKFFEKMAIDHCAMCTYCRYIL